MDPIEWLGRARRAEGGTLSQGPSHSDWERDSRGPGAPVNCTGPLAITPLLSMQPAWMRTPDCQIGLRNGRGGVHARCKTAYFHWVLAPTEI